MKAFLRLITNKVLMLALFVFIEFVVLMYFMVNLSVNYATVHLLITMLSLVLILHVINRNDNPFYRLAWSIFILAIPPVGAVAYLAFAGKQVPKRLRESFDDAYHSEDYGQDSQVMRDFIRKDTSALRLVSYINNAGHFPLYQNTKGTYLKSGELKLEAMLDALESATHFIFLEYFIIKDGVMWQSVFEVLERKVKEGVIVRLIYDDWGCALFPKLQSVCDRAGIEAYAFNPLRARLAIQMNNRDHRKICVVDGRIGFVGGANLADEYINIGSKYGHWKDTAVMIEGDAVYSLTLMFLQMYRYYSGVIEEPYRFKYEFETVEDAQGYVMPFADAPTDNVDVGVDAHLKMIMNAKRYIYIQTPYLIIGYEIIEALKIAARSGVDVRIVVPHIPDKKLVNQVTKSNYDALLQAGVKIYEYKPGFVHSKTMVADDEFCVVGTTNMDYRSYYLHFECSILFIDSDVVKACYNDAVETFEASIEITCEDAANVSLATRWIRSFARIFSGLM